MEIASLRAFPFALAHEGRRLQPLRSSLLTATTVAVPPVIGVEMRALKVPDTLPA
jgi:hypothetical protein